MTFTIAGFDRSSGAIGAAVSTASAACGKRVLHYRPKVGLVVTQGKTNVRYGSQGLALLQQGSTPDGALKSVQQLDAHLDYRQVLMTDVSAHWSVFTGSGTEAWRGHVVERDFVAMGNTLAGEHVLDAMASAFRRSSGNLGSRLVRALLAGDSAGGDREGKRSAAIVVIAPDEFEPYGAALDLRVDFDADPVVKLGQALDAYSAWEAAQLTRIDRRLYYFSAEEERNV